MFARLLLGGIGFLSVVCGVAIVVRADTPAADPPLAHRQAADSRGDKRAISGRYPHLAMFNHQGECGTGAVVPWADRLWVITYGPHLLNGSDDKLYEIDAELNRVTRSESVGGTPANRMIHRESNQLVIGPYLIDKQRNVRVVSPKVMPGRLTATTRSLTDPAGKVNVYTMEGSLWEVDVKTLAPQLLFERAVPGWHAKGAYLSQGRIVVAHNGEHAVSNTRSNYLAGSDKGGPEDAGVLAEYDGQDWRIIERRQFTEVTGPGGIRGEPDDKTPLWSIGWDQRSLLLKLLDGGQWYTFRLPKADYSYDGKHGWHTEWPRIREVANGKFLMNMHGGWFDFPATFSAANNGGLKPIASYLKVTADFCGWQNQIVFGCDDLAKNDFQGGSAGEQSQSNLWFTTWEKLPKNGRPAGWGSVWQRDRVSENTPSDPFLFAGYQQRVLHLAHGSPKPLHVEIEVDETGAGNWRTLEMLEVPALGYVWKIFDANTPGQWIRLRTRESVDSINAAFHYGPGGGLADGPGEHADGLKDADAGGPFSPSHLVPLGGDRGTLLYTRGPDDTAYEIGPTLEFQSTNVKVAAKKSKSQISVTYDEASVIVQEGGNRVRLPKTSAAYEAADAAGARLLREVATERSLLNAHGTFYVLPRANSGGVRRIKPVCTHGKRIADYCSWRGLLVLAGDADLQTPNPHLFTSADKSVGLWLGDIDDLWQFGKPVGHGGPWKNTLVKAGLSSDPYLMTGYDRKKLSLSHDADQPVNFTVEVDFDGTGWRPYQTFAVPAGETITHEFALGYHAHWWIITSDTNCTATAWSEYE